MVVRTVFGIIFCTFSAVLLMCAAGTLYINFIFERRFKRVGRTFATLESVKHKRNVTLYRKAHFGGPIVPWKTLKHLSRGVYTYTVHGKTYRIKYNGYEMTNNQMPYGVSVMYLKKIPRISYIRDLGNNYGIYALAFAGIAAVCLCGGLGMFFRVK